MMIGIWLIAALQQVYGMPQLQCLTCSDFNRESNGQSCIESHNDCGFCLPGLVESVDDNRICVAVEIYQQPEAAYDVKGNTGINLPCKFNYPVTCFWIRNGREVEIADHSRYQYVDDAAKRYDKTYTCSINIKSVSKHDSGQWNCGGWINYNQNLIVSNNATITVSDIDSHYFLGEKNTAPSVASVIPLTKFKNTSLNSFVIVIISFVACLCIGVLVLLMIIIICLIRRNLRVHETDDSRESVDKRSYNKDGEKQPIEISGLLVKSQM
ncbi:hypothetical protein CHUAL_006796 [Chamberlinius hualienensis]